MTPLDDLRYGCIYDVRHKNCTWSRRLRFIGLVLPDRKFTTCGKLLASFESLERNLVAFDLYRFRQDYFTATPIEEPNATTQSNP